MSREDFLEAFFGLLPIVADRSWEVTSLGTIRDEDGRCPICAIAHEIDPTINYLTCANMTLREFGLEVHPDDVCIVTISADCRLLIGARNCEIRARMLSILNLTEAAQ